ncbi:MAG: ABC transporter ATP-binding protein [Solirubrobacterales bacterium]|nr:ABC transporter ATP-binding protein [Solirubrobacterales bacterium]
MSGLPPSRISSDAPVAVSVRDLRKSFSIPDQKVSSLKELALHPFRRIEFRTLEALGGVSFEVRKGEFFGIVGRNGSGKSTLLKIISSIYRSDSGDVHLAGRMAPFIELGVGFDPELNARENIVLNGVMMGLTPRDARSRVDAVIGFAELEPFAELKLKNYSSGMLVRLAFAAMIQADADVLLIDEVLAVGDASFQQKCSDVFHNLKDQGKTIILVTHDMASVETFCDRALLIEEGTVRHIGDPEEVGRRYLRMNFDEERGRPVTRDPGEETYVHLVEGSLKSDAGDTIQNLEVGQPINVEAVLEARQTIPRPIVGLLFTNEDGVRAFGGTEPLFGPDEDLTLEPGTRFTVNATFENKLTKGRYTVGCFVAREVNHFDFPMAAMRLVDFVVYGVDDAAGVFTPDGEIEVGLVD